MYESCSPNSVDMPMCGCLSVLMRVFECVMRVFVSACGGMHVRRV